MIAYSATIQMQLCRQCPLNAHDVRGEIAMMITPTNKRAEQ